MEKFKWKIALPAPTLYGQFDNLDDVDYVLDGDKIPAGVDCKFVDENLVEISKKTTIIVNKIFLFITVPLKNRYCL